MSTTDNQDSNSDAFINLESQQKLKRKPNNNEEKNCLTSKNYSKKSKLNSFVDNDEESTSDSILEISKIEEPKFNSGFSDNLALLKQLYNDPDKEQKSEFVEKHVQIIKKPFKVAQLRNFIENDSILNSILHAASSLVLNKRNNDLFSFKQSKDLKSYPIFENIVKFFQTEVKPFLEELTGLNLNDYVALTFSKYEKNDYLLCHDDQLDERKIAFILYLVDEKWSANDGGQLELFSVTEDDFQPSKVTEHLTPQSNTLTFFEVLPTSFHQVSEILTSRSPRWSINGWFHSNNVKVTDQDFIYPSLPIFPEEDILDDDLSEHFFQWINPIYLDITTQKQIRQNFIYNSEIQLKNFILPKKRKELELALSSDVVQNIWKEFYKPLFCRYEFIPHDDFLKLPNVLREFYLLIHSKHFYKLITRITGVCFGGTTKAIAKNDSKKADSKSDDHKNKKNCDNTNEDNHEVQLIEDVNSDSGIKKENHNHLTRGWILRWKHGYYSLPSDINPDIDEKALDLDFFFNVSCKKTSSTKNFGDQEIIDISDSDDEKKDNDKQSEKNDINVSNSAQTATPSSTNKNKPEPEIIELDDEDSDDEEDEEFSEESDDSEINHEDEDESDDERSAKCSDHFHYDEYEHENDHDSYILKGGGYIAYITDDSNEQILEIEPKNSYLNIVYRRYHCQRFMKYIDSSNNRVPFHQITVVFADN